MPLPDYISRRIAEDIRQQMEGVAALTGKLAASRLPPEAQACVAGVEAAAAAVRRLLDADHDLRATTDGGIALNLEPIRLHDLLDEVQERWRTRTAQGGARLLASYDGDPEAAAMADRYRLLQLFDGFIGEAMSASCGVIEASVHVRPSPGGVVLEGRVRGPGHGLEGADSAARVRAVEARLGLEVAIGALLAGRIVEGLGGELRREMNPGAAETVSFQLPLAALAAPARAPAPEVARPAHVLVVDDNATNRMVAQSLVEMFDCTSEAAEDGLEAVEAARSGRYDLILMDIKMPNMDGVAATRAIRGLRGPVGQVPIIALTANADPDDTAGYLAAGMNGVVEKPMKPEQLLAALQAALAGEPSAARAASAAA